MGPPDRRDVRSGQCESRLALPFDERVISEQDLVTGPHALLAPTGVGSKLDSAAQ
jgi:hypothetical protein